ncbi:MAG: hypothetical protein ACM3NN_15790 [Nitrospirota bacterium]
MPTYFNSQSIIGNSDENREHAKKVGVGNRQFPRIFSLCIGEVAEWLKAALC